MTQSQTRGLLRFLLSGIRQPRTGAPAASVPSAMAHEALARQRMQEHRYLHLACGGNIKSGWSNVDLADAGPGTGWDLTLPLPVDSGYMRLIYCEHFIEHIEHGEAGRLLAECRRVLEPGGVLRVSTPDLRRLADKYLSGRLD